ncbi:MAG: phosphoenolpyruvate carboxykinase (GTP) [Desulfobacteraceae bacterium]|nr:MAG: phosphoenolpyruvate carboxykinase (GTP) [Desulfobacteraceae bacterium]
MGLRKDVIDIASEIGKISSVGEAMNVFKSKMDKTHLSRIRQINSPQVLIKIANAIELCAPDSAYVNTGSEEDLGFMRELALKKGEESKLAMPNHTIHFDLREEQGRIIDRTFYIETEGEEISSLAKKMDRNQALEEIRTHMGGIMKGMRMLIGFYARGPIGSPASDPALELTSSAYVMHSAELLYRNAYSAFDRELQRAGYFYANIHSEGRNRAEDLPNARVFMDRNHLTTYAFNCTYAGNTLLMKKGNHRFSVDRSVYINRGKELAEHMFITGMGKNGRISWCLGAAPSGCGKTTTAMAGTHFVGDDLAQIWIDDSGAVRAINPESGIFGIVEDVNREGDPMLMDCLRKPKTEVIWSNVLVDPNGVPHWTGNGEEPPEKGINFQGQWKKGMVDKNGKPIPMSHPNARATLRSSALANYSEKNEDPAGVEVRVITYSGRDSDTMPPVWVAKTPDQGVVIGACIVSAATATEVGATGVKRAPWANAPFTPGALGDYMDAQFQFFNSKKIAPEKRPLMAGLNYFLTEEARGGSSRKLLGEKRDVKVWLSWLERRAHKEIDAIQTPIGYLPEYEDLKKLFQTVIRKEYSKELYLKQFSLYIDNIVARIDLQKDAYTKEPKVPEKFFTLLAEQRSGLIALREAYGPVVAPDQLEKSGSR